jgi:predicted DNA-binding protein with PD1-like motif
MKFREFKAGRKFLGLIETGKDLLTELKEFAKANNIKAGTFNLIGATRSATIGFYEARTQQYVEITINKHLEIVSCTGNISQLDGDTKVHAHICLSDENGHTFSGHLLSQTDVFAAEVSVEEYTGAELNRAKHPQTGLPLWKFD